MMRWHGLVALLCLATAGGARAQTLLLENFDDGVADEFTVTSPPWKVQDTLGSSDARSGVYHSRVDGFEVSAVSVAGASDWTDYQLDLDLLVLGSVNQVVRFRIQDDSNFLQFNVRSAPYDDVFLERVENGQHVVLAQVPGFVNQIGVWHHITVSVTGNFIVAKYDGQIVASAFDTSITRFASGPIGVVAYSGGVIQWQDAYVDDVVVTSLQPVAVEPLSWGRLKATYGEARGR
ncbi:MAG: hypothetical protein U0167_12740 [bacterium]